MQNDMQVDLVNRFVDHLENGTTDTVPHSLQVPGAHYTDHEQTQLEVERLFKQQPLLVALTPDLPEPGSYLTHTAYDTDLLLVRDDVQKVRAYINACRHRGARLAYGRGEAKTFSCPFHAWNWSRDGKLISRPNSDGGFDDTHTLCDQLLERPCLEISGMIFALLDGDGIEEKVRAKLGDALGDIDGYNIPGTAYFGERAATRDCNYKFIIDGFCESYHIAALHKDSISPYYYTTPALSELMGDTVRMIGVRRSIEKEFDKPTTDRRLLPHGTTQYLIAPNVVLTHQVDHIQFWRVYPDPDADHCRIEFSLYWPKPMDEEAQRKSQFNIDAIWNVVTKEDFPQSLAIHHNLKSGALDALYFGRNEPSLSHYHNTIARHIGSDKLTTVDQIT